MEWVLRKAEVFGHMMLKSEITEEVMFLETQQGTPRPSPWPPKIL